MAKLSLSSPLHFIYLFIFCTLPNKSPWLLHIVPRPNPIVPCDAFLSGKKDHKYDEEDHQYEEYLNHQPAVGRDRLKVFEDLSVGHFHVQLSVLHVGIDPTERQEKRPWVVFNVNETVKAVRLHPITNLESHFTECVICGTPSHEFVAQKSRKTLIIINFFKPYLTFLNAI